MKRCLAILSLVFTFILLLSSCDNEKPNKTMSTVPSGTTVIPSTTSKPLVPSTTTTTTNQPTSTIQKEITSISINKNNAKVNYELGETISYNSVLIYGNYSDSSIQLISDTGDYVFEVVDSTGNKVEGAFTTAGEYEVIVKGPNELTASYKVTVNPKVIEYSLVEALDATEKYNFGESYSLEIESIADSNVFYGFGFSNVAGGHPLGADRLQLQATREDAGKYSGLAVRVTAPCTITIPFVTESTYGYTATLSLFELVNNNGVITPTKVKDLGESTSNAELSTFTYTYIGTEEKVLYFYSSGRAAAVFDVVVAYTYNSLADIPAETPSTREVEDLILDIKDVNTIYSVGDTISYENIKATYLMSDNTIENIDDLTTLTYEVNDSQGNKVEGAFTTVGEYTVTVKSTNIVSATYVINVNKKMITYSLIEELKSTNVYSYGMNYSFELISIAESEVFYGFGGSNLAQNHSLGDYRLQLQATREDTGKYSGLAVRVTAPCTITIPFVTESTYGYTATLSVLELINDNGTIVPTKIKDLGESTSNAELSTFTYTYTGTEEKVLYFYSSGRAAAVFDVVVAYAADDLENDSTVETPSNKEIVAILANALNAKLEYEIGEEFNSKYLRVNVMYNDNSIEYLSDLSILSFEVTNSQGDEVEGAFAEAGEYTVTVKTSNNVSTSYVVTVKSKTDEDLPEEDENTIVEVHFTGIILNGIALNFTYTEDIVVGTTITLADYLQYVLAAGYEVEGWYLDEECTQPIDVTTYEITGETHFYIKQTLITE